MNLKVLAGVIIFAGIVFGAWFFFWPLVECTYAVSWEPLMTPSHKPILFCAGGFIFFGAVISGIRLMI